MNLDERTREAIAAELKAEAGRMGLSGDAFWSHVYAGVEKAAMESGDLPRPRTKKAAPAA